MRDREEVQMRITGTQEEIYKVIALLSEVGISVGYHKFYPRRSEPNRFSFYVRLCPEWLTKAIEHISAKNTAIASSAAIAPNDNDPKPRPHDAVLGGSAKNQPGNRFVLSKDGELRLL